MAWCGQELYLYFTQEMVGEAGRQAQGCVRDLSVSGCGRWPCSLAPGPGVVRAGGQWPANLMTEVMSLHVKGTLAECCDKLALGQMAHLF